MNTGREGRICRTCRKGNKLFILAEAWDGRKMAIDC
jgi:hypothetical protein